MSNLDYAGSAHNLFLQQNYVDSWNDYQYLLTHGKPVRWDWFVVTASNEEQARSYMMQIEYRKKNGWLPSGTKYIVIPDPDGKRVGSGGATINVLKYIQEQSEEDDPFIGKRILVIHSGGDSKRVPQYSACGKLFSRVLRELPDGRCSTLFDEFVIALSGIPSRMSDGLLVISGDVLLLFNPLQIDLQREGSVCISIKAPVEVGEHHGVFLPDKNGCVKSFLHKQSKVQLSEAGAVNELGYIDIDTGAIWLSSCVIKSLLCLITKSSSIDEALFQKFVNEKVRLSFYGDFVYPMVTEATLQSYLKEPTEGISCSELEDCRRALWTVLNQYPMNLIRLSPAEFIHFGTTQELHDLMLSASDKYGFLGWSRNVMSTGNDVAASINCVVEQGAQIDPAVYIEDSYVASKASIGKRCVLSNTRFNGNLAPDTILHVLPVFFNNGTGFVARIYGIKDNPKDGLYNNGTFLGLTLKEFLDKHWLNEDEIWINEDRSLWSAKLYPVCGLESQAIEAAMTIQKMASGEISSAEFDTWRYSCRMSLQESFQAAHIGKIMELQEELEDTVRTTRFINAVLQGIWVKEVVALLGTDLSLIRRMRMIISKIMDSAVHTKFRIFKALSEVSRKHNIKESDLTPDLLEDICYNTINSAIRVETLRTLSTIPFNCIASESVDVELPIRVNWGGGWSDTPPYCFEYGGTVLNAALSLHRKLPVKVSVRRMDKPVIRLESHDLKLCREFDDVLDLQRYDNPSDPFALHKAALVTAGILPQNGLTISLYDQLKRLGGGLHLCTNVDVPKGSGLGTSSILAGAVAKALSRILGQPDDNQRLFDQVLCTEQLMTTGGGWQDQVGGLVPGIKLIVSYAGIPQKIDVQILKLSTRTMQELDERFVLVYTGQRRLARNLLREIMSKYILNQPDTLEILKKIQHIAVLMRFELEKGNIEDFTILLNEHWELSKKLDAGSTNTYIDQIIHVCRPLVDGVFIAGAGGGGFLQMILKKGVESHALKKVLEEVFQDSGVEVWDCNFVW